MSDTVLLEIVKTTGIIVTAVLSLIAVIWTARGRKETKELKVMVDGRLTDLLESNKVKDHALGKAEGIKEQKAEAKVELTAPTPIELKIAKLEVELKPPNTPPPNQ